MRAKGMQGNRFRVAGIRALARAGKMLAGVLLLTACAMPGEILPAVSALHFRGTY